MSQTTNQLCIMVFDGYFMAVSIVCYGCVDGFVWLFQWCCMVVKNLQTIGILEIGPTKA